MEFWKAIQMLGDKAQEVHAKSEADKRVLVKVNGRKVVDIEDIVVSETEEGVVLLMVEVPGATDLLEEHEERQADSSGLESLRGIAAS